MAGLIGYPCAGAARYPEFYDDLRYLELPEATFFSYAAGPYIPINRNKLCQEAIDNDAEWLLMIDDDHRFQPDLLKRLLAHKADVIVPFVLRRQVPYMSLIYTDTSRKSQWGVMPLSKLPMTGQLEVIAAATSCMLIHRHVLDAIPPPWFEMGKSDDGDLSGEDLEWSKKLRDHGFKILLDADTRIGHISQVVIWPGEQQDVRIDLGSGIDITLKPQISLE